MRKQLNWKTVIDSLTWSKSDLIPLTDTSSESKITKNKWYETRSIELNEKSELNQWENIANDLRDSDPNISNLTAHKYRIYPDRETRILYNKVFGILRVLRNEANLMIKAWIIVAREMNKTLPEGEKKSLLPPKKYLRKHLIKDDSEFCKTRRWLLEVNFDLRDQAILDLLNDYKSAFAKKEPFEIGLRTREHNLISCSFSIPKRHWYTKGFWSRLVPNDYECVDSRFRRYSKRFIRHKDRMSDEVKDLIKQGFYPDSINKLPKKLQHEAVVKRVNGEYYICITMNPLEQKESKEGLFVIDPGYRTVFTGINFKDNVLEEIGINPGKVITKELEEISKLDSLIHSKAKIIVNGKTKKINVKTGEFRKRTRYNLKKRIRKKRKRVKNLICDLHKTVSKYLCENFSTIVIPKLNFHGLGLRKRKKELAQRISHCSFVDNLVNKSKQYVNCKILVVGEEFTSKTCSRCGAHNKDLGASKEFICPRCEVRIDRDVNAVYNILMRKVHLNNIGESD